MFRDALELSNNAKGVSTSSDVVQVLVASNAKTGLSNLF
jgi:hypothetical protein